MGKGSKSKVARLEDALDMLLGEKNNAGEDSGEPSSELTTQPVNNLTSDLNNQQNIQPVNKLTVQPIDQSADLLTNQSNIQPDDKSAGQTSDFLTDQQDNRIDSPKDNELNNSKDEKITKQQAKQPDDEINGRRNIESDSHLNSEVVREQDETPKIKVDKQLNKKTAGGKTGQQTIKKEKETYSDPFIEAIRVQLFSYLSGEPGERVSAGGRIPGKLWSLVTLYCTYTKKQMQDFLEEALVEKLKNELGIN
jgi:hypothetical protein